MCRKVKKKCAALGLKCQRVRGVESAPPRGDERRGAGRRTAQVGMAAAGAPSCRRPAVSLSLSLRPRCRSADGVVDIVAHIRIWSRVRCAHFYPLGVRRSSGSASARPQGAFMAPVHGACVSDAQVSNGLAALYTKAHGTSACASSDAGQIHALFVFPSKQERKKKKPIY